KHQPLRTRRHTKEKTRASSFLREPSRPSWFLGFHGVRMIFGSHARLWLCSKHSEGGLPGDRFLLYILQNAESRVHHLLVHSPVLGSCLGEGDRDDLVAL